MPMPPNFSGYSTILLLESTTYGWRCCSFAGACQLKRFGFNSSRLAIIVMALTVCLGISKLYADAAPVPLDNSEIERLREIATAESEPAAKRADALSRLIQHFSQPNAQSAAITASAGLLAG